MAKNTPKTPPKPAAAQNREQGDDGADQSPVSAKPADVASVTTAHQLITPQAAAALFGSQPGTAAESEES